MFHLAIPTNNLESSKSFYQSLGLRIGRESDQFVIIDFFGHQLVCHLDPEEVVEKPQMYPRHFGLIVEDESRYEELLSNARERKLSFFKDDFRRHQGKKAEHRSFFLKDESNNLIEFKWYRDPNSIF